MSPAAPDRDLNPAYQASSAYSSPDGPPPSAPAPPPLRITWVKSTLTHTRSPKPASCPCSLSLPGAGRHHRAWSGLHSGQRGEGTGCVWVQR